MEWKWIKSLLIVVFLSINIFLIYQLNLKNNVIRVNSDMVESVENVFKSRGIECNFDLSKIEYKNNMKKIKISDEENLSAAFISLGNVEKGNYLGRNRETISLPLIISEFIRDTKTEKATIEKIELGYYPELSQLDNNVLSGEAIPAWRIKLASGEEYIYNAYLGERMN